MLDHGGDAIGIGVLVARQIGDCAIQRYLSTGPECQGELVRW